MKTDAVTEEWVEDTWESIGLWGRPEQWSIIQDAHNVALAQVTARADRFEKLCRIQRKFGCAGTQYTHIANAEKLQKALEQLTARAEAAEANFGVVLDSLRKAINFAEWGWGIIANANGGNWETVSKEWQDAAAKYRDQFHDEIRYLALFTTAAAEVKRKALEEKNAGC